MITDRCLVFLNIALHTPTAVHMNVHPCQLNEGHAGAHVFEKETGGPLGLEVLPSLADGRMWITSWLKEPGE